MRCSLLLATIAAVNAADYYWAGVSVSLSNDARWVGGVNPLTSQVSMTQFGSTGQTSIGSIPVGSTFMAGNRLVFGGSARIVFGSGGTSTISLAAAPSSSATATLRQQSGVQNGMIGNYSNGFNWNNPVNWVTAVGSQTHPMNPPGPNDRAFFTVTPGMTYFATNFMGVSAGAGSITDGTMTVTDCSGAVATSAGAMFGSTLVSLDNACSLGASAVSVGADFGEGSYTFTAADGTQYRVLTIYDGAASVTNNGMPWIYSIDTAASTLTGPLSDASIQLPCRLGYGVCSSTPTAAGVTYMPTHAPATTAPTTHVPTSASPTTHAPTTLAPTGSQSPTDAGATQQPSAMRTFAPTTHAPVTRQPTTHAPVTVQPTTQPPVSANTGNSGGGGGGGGGIDLMLIIIIAAAVIVIVVVAVLLKKRSGGGGGSGGLAPAMDTRVKGVGFENPLYDHNDDYDPNAAADAGDYMDLPAADGEGGYMDVEHDNTYDESYEDPATTGGDATGGYMDMPGQDDDDDDY